MNRYFNPNGHPKAVVFRLGSQRLVESLRLNEVGAIEPVCEMQAEFAMPQVGVWHVHEFVEIRRKNCLCLHRKRHFAARAYPYPKTRFEPYGVQARASA